MNEHFYLKLINPYDLIKDLVSQRFSNLKLRTFWFLYSIFVAVILFSCDSPRKQINQTPGKLQFIFKERDTLRSIEDFKHSVLLFFRSDSIRAINNPILVDCIPVQGDYFSLPLELTPGVYHLDSAKLILFNENPELNIRIKKISLSEFPDQILIRPNVVFPVSIPYQSVSENPALSVFGTGSGNGGQNLFPVRFNATYFDYQDDTVKTIRSTLKINADNSTVALLYLSYNQKFNLIPIPEQADSLSFITRKESFLPYLKTLSIKDINMKVDSPINLFMEKVGKPTKSAIIRIPFNQTTLLHGKTNYPGNGTNLKWTSDRFGNKNAAAFFDGTAQVDYGDIFNETPLPVTISAWIKIKDPKRKKPWIIFHTDFTKEIQVYAGFNFAFSNSGLNSSYSDGSGIGYQFRRTVLHNISENDTSWMHILTVLKNVKERTLYHNGKKLDAKIEGIGGILVHNKYPLVVGFGFSGSIDDLTVFDYALKPDEIDSLYQTELKKPFLL